ncbi:MAG: ABC transporter ATP-binding protein [Anaerolineales bacterium]|nr:ABC transporter ATP-binding protein [Anaerolineales bacterium]
MLEIKSLSVNYGSRKVLDDITLEVMPGELLVVIGPNGAGKTTLIRAVSGALPLRHGSVQVNGLDLSRLSHAQRARQMAVVPQARNLPAAVTVYQSVLMGRTPYVGWLGHAGQKDHHSARAALERTSCVELIERPVGELSGANNSACCSPAPWRRKPPSCSWTSPPRTWICATNPACSTWFGSLPRNSSLPC